VKKFLATLLIACFAFTFTVSSIGCSGEKTSKKEEKTPEKKSEEGKKDAK
jgi:hypothetical protein